MIDILVRCMRHRLCCLEYVKFEFMNTSLDLSKIENCEPILRRDVDFDSVRSISGYINIKWLTTQRSSPSDRSNRCFLATIQAC